MSGIYIAIIIVLVVIVLVAIAIWICGSSEGFTTRPKGKEKEAIVSMVLRHAYAFDPQVGSLDIAKRSINGIDNVMYEDFRSLYMLGKFNKESLLAAIG